MKLKFIAPVAVALVMSATLAGCSAPTEEEQTADIPEITVPQTPAEEQPQVEQPEAEEPAPEVKPTVVTPQVRTVTYITVTAASVNFRSGAGTGYSVSGQAEKNTLYACLGEVGGWYKTYYKNKTAYISKKYCATVDMRKGSDKIESVIEEGTKLLGAPYVYGAVRVHDGKGNKLKGFTTDAFDCSSLMQYMFYKGADKLIDVNTRTQIYQGTTVSKSDLKRGDLMFFTNDSRKDNKGIERVGHVAMYLGDNYILHTASDYAKIEKISTTRWGYFIQAQRMI